MWRCGACGTLATAPAWTCAGCGVEGALDAVGELERAARRAYCAKSIASAEDEPTIACAAPLALALGGGVSARAVVLVAGPPGAGKSTEVARLALELGRATPSMAAPLVCDAEMSAAQCRDVWRRAGAEPRELARAVRICPDGWPVVIAAQRELGSEIVIVDSLQKLARANRARVAFLHELGRIDALVLVVAHVARHGGVSGSVELEHDVDAVAFVTKRHVRGVKCRWARERTIARASHKEQQQERRRLADGELRLVGGGERGGGGDDGVGGRKGRAGR